MAKPGTLQETLEYAAARSMLFILGAMPRSMAVATGRVAGRIAYRMLSKLRRTGERNLQLAYPEQSEAEHARTLRGSFESLGRLLGEFSHFPNATPESLRRMIVYDEESIQRLREVQKDKRGIIFLTGHIGAWELISFAWSALEHPLSFLVRPIDNPRVEELIENMRTRFGNTAINKKTAARAAIRVLRDGGTLGILADLNTHPHEGVFVPFFNHLACTTAGAATLALRTDAAVMPVCAVWEEARKCFVFYGLPLVELVRTGDDKRDVEINTANFTAALEQLIRRHPEQWLWIHKRWRTRPQGEPDLYAASHTH
jgi:KDO2-lipid IV(A) lauroyltransferase